MKKLLIGLGLSTAAVSCALVMTPVAGAAGPAYSDIVGIKFDGTMMLYTNTGNMNRPFSKKTQIGSGWNKWQRTLMGDLKGDNRAMIMAYNGPSAAQPAGEAMFYHNSNTAYPYSKTKPDSFALGEHTTIAHLSGLAGRHCPAQYVTLRSSGRVVAQGVGMYRSGPHKDRAIFCPDRLISRGWSGVKSIMAGDVNGGGFDDLAAVKQDGTLWLYRNNGRYQTSEDSPLHGGRQIGHGWHTFNKVMMADVNDDAKADIVARKPDGTLWLYLNNGNIQRPFDGTARRIGGGWGVYKELHLANVHDTTNSVTLMPNDYKVFEGDARIVNTAHGKAVRIAKGSAKLHGQKRIDKVHNGYTYTLFEDLGPLHYRFNKLTQQFLNKEKSQQAYRVCARIMTERKNFNLFISGSLIYLDNTIPTPRTVCYDNRSGIEPFGGIQSNQPIYVYSVKYTML